MCKIILPIKPEYAEKIMDGDKMYEFRKISCKREIDGIILYSTAPVQSIIGEVKVVDVIKESPEVIWEKTREEAGITKKKFFDYFANASEAIAYKLGEVMRFDEPRALSEYGINYSPQSFVYIE